MDVAAKSSTDRALEYLEHYGIKGMKWGVRRDRGVGGVAKKSENDVDSAVSDESSAKARATYLSIQKNGLASVSSSDLRQLVERLTIEENYKRAILQARENEIKEKQARSVLTKIDRGNKSVKVVLTSAKIIMDINDILNKTTGQSTTELAKKAAKVARTAAR